MSEAPNKTHRSDKSSSARPRSGKRVLKNLFLFVFAPLVGAVAFYSWQMNPWRAIDQMHAGFKGQDAAVIERNIDEVAFFGSIDRSENSRYVPPLDALNKTEDRVTSWEALAVLAGLDWELAPVDGAEQRRSVELTVTYTYPHGDLAMEIPVTFALSLEPAPLGEMHWKLGEWLNSSEVASMVRNAEQRRLDARNRAAEAELQAIISDFEYSETIAGRHMFSNGTLIVEAGFTHAGASDIVSGRGALRIVGKTTGTEYATAPVALGGKSMIAAGARVDVEGIWRLDPGEGNDALIRAAETKAEPLEVTLVLTDVTFADGRRVGVFENYNELLAAL
jgi:hypothetical protein